MLILFRVVPPSDLEAGLLGEASWAWLPSLKVSYFGGGSLVPHARMLRAPPLCPDTSELQGRSQLKLTQRENLLCIHIQVLQNLDECPCGLRRVSASTLLLASNKSAFTKTKL